MRVVRLVSLFLATVLSLPAAATPRASAPASAALTLTVTPDEGAAVTVERRGTIRYDLAVTDDAGQPVADVTVTVSLTNNGVSYPDQTLTLGTDGTGAFVWDLPGSVEAGDLRIGFAARRDGFDTDYAYRSATVVASQPTLAVQPVSVEPSVAVPGGSLTLSFDITDPAGETVSPVDLKVDVYMDGGYVDVDWVYGVTDGTYTFAVPSTAPLGGTYSFLVSASADGFERSYPVAIDVLVAAGVAEVQLLHASAALDVLGIGPVEVYVDQDPASTTPDAVVDFQSATPFLHLPAGRRYSVRFRPVAPPPPPFPRELTFTLPREPHPALPPGRFIVSLVGIPSVVSGAFATHPDGRPRDLTIVPAAAAPPSGRGGGLPVVVVHAVTDASALDVVVRETGVRIAQGVVYGEASAPAYLAPGTYTLDVRATATGERLDSRTLTIDGEDPSVAFAITGFRTPSANQNGPALAVSSVASDGSSDAGTPAPAAVASESAEGGALRLAARPHPAVGSVVVTYGVASPGPVRVAVYDALGRAVAVLVDGDRPAGFYEVPVASGRLAPGRYLIRLESAERTATTPLTVIR